MKDKIANYRRIRTAVWSHIRSWHVGCIALITDNRKARKQSNTLTAKPFYAARRGRPKMAVEEHS